MAFICRTSGPFPVLALPGGGGGEMNAPLVHRCVCVWLRGPGSTPGASRPPTRGGEGGGIIRAGGMCLVQATGTAEAASAFCVRAAGVGLPDDTGTDRGWRLRKGQGGSVQGWLRNGDRKGPRGGGVEASAASPCGPAAGSAVAATSLAFLPSVVWAGFLDPPGCQALSGVPGSLRDPAWEEVHALVGLKV